MAYLVPTSPSALYLPYHHLPLTPGTFCSHPSPPAGYCLHWPIHSCSPPSLLQHVAGRLHWLLEANRRLRWDVDTPITNLECNGNPLAVRLSRSGSEPELYDIPATSPCLRELKIEYHGHFTWRMLLFHPSLTVGDVLDGIRDMFQKPLTAAEWRTLDPDQQTELYAYACERLKVLPSTRAFDGHAVIRLDCLGEKRNFGGLQPTRDPSVWRLKLTN